MSSEEREIDLIDLFWNVCINWKRIIVMGAIGVVLGILVGYIMSASSTKDYNVVLQENGAIDLTDEQKEELEIYNLYKADYEKWNSKLYTEDIMHINTEDVCVENIIIWINNNKNSREIAYLIKSHVDKNNKLFGIYSDISSSVIIDNNAIKIDSDIEDGTLLSVNIYGLSELECNNHRDELKTYIENKKTQLERDMGKFDYKYVSDEMNFDYCDDILNYQSKIRESIWASRAAKNTVYNQISNETREYIDAVEQSDNLEITKSSSIGNIRFMLKYIVLGFIAMIFIAVAINILMYLFNQKIRFEDKIESIFNQKLLVQFSKKRYKGITNWLINMRRQHIHSFSEEEAIDMIVSAIKVGTRDTNKRVFISGCDLTEYEKKIFEKVASNISDVEVVIGKSIRYYADALEKSSEIGQILLVETAGVARYEEIEDEINCCNNNNINIIGMVVIEN